MPLRLVYVLCAVQFVNILDFIMVMPLGPDFSQGLGIPTSYVGIVGGSYTLAAAAMGLIGSAFLDRFERRRALLVAFLGLSCSTILGGCAVNFETLVAARILAGLCGGPATALTMSIIADTVDEQYRGRALGILMGSFSLAAVFGVPIGLELANQGGWHVPFFAVGFLGLLLLPVISVSVPQIHGHISQDVDFKVPSWSRSFALMRNPLYQRMLILVFVSMSASFLVIPNIATYLQFNLNYPRSDLGMLYMIGGVCSFVTMRFAGAMVDRVGAARTGTIGTICLCTIIFLGFVQVPEGAYIVIIFAGFMVAMSLRNVPMQTLASRVPLPQERASYLSLQSAVQHLASSTGAILSARMLVSEPSGFLKHMPLVAAISISLAMLMPWLLFTIESRLSSRNTDKK